MPQQFESSFYRVAADRKVVSIRKSSAKCPGLLSTQNESLDEAVLGPISSDFGFRARTISAQFRGSLSLSLFLCVVFAFSPQLKDEHMRMCMSEDLPVRLRRKKLDQSTLSIWLQGDLLI